MSSIILELQAEASNKSIPVSDLLRKAKIIAVKLELNDLLKWVDAELNGYGIKAKEDLPSYRMIPGDVQAFNPYHGWQSIIFPVETAKMFLKNGVNNPIGELEVAVNSGKEGLTIILSPELKDILRKSIGFNTDIRYAISAGSLTGILEGVRNSILDWALKLEKEGIVGEGISFSQAEKERAQEAKTIININSIGNFAGNMGDVSHNMDMIIKQQNTLNFTEVQKLIKQITDNFSNINIPEADKAHLIEEVQKISLEVESSNRDVGKIKRAFQSIKRILEGASGNVIAQGILYGIEKVIN